MRSLKQATRPAVIEGLENRQLLSAAPPVVSYSPVSPGKILAGSKPGYETIVVRNLTTAPVTETITASVAPSLDGVNAAGSFGDTTTTETVTIKKHGSVKLKVAFVPPVTLAAGKYRTLVAVDVAGESFTGVAPGAYTLKIPPLPTTSPSLIGDFSGLITATSRTTSGLFNGGHSTTIHQASFIWQTTSQDDSSLTGLFAVGDGQTTGTMQGYELTNGVLHYTLASDNINYTIDAKVSPDGSKITGKFKGTLVNNIFNSLGGTFTLKRQS